MRILSTSIEELSANESNHASAARMKVRGMIRSLSIEEVNGHVYINSRMLHGSHMICHWNSPSMAIFWIITAAVPFIIRRMHAVM